MPAWLPSSSPAGAREGQARVWVGQLPPQQSTPVLCFRLPRLCMPRNREAIRPQTCSRVSTISCSALERLMKTQRSRMVSS